MKAFRFTFLLVMSLLFINAPSYAYVVSPTSAAATLEKAEGSTALSAKQLKKQQKKEARAQKRAERRAKFMAWVSKKMAGDNDQLIAIILVIFVGGLGIHRVFLGSNPIIILWYLLTLGGIFGLIPLIDLIRLAIGQVDHYRGNDALIRAFQPA